MHRPRRTIHVHLLAVGLALAGLLLVSPVARGEDDEALPMVLLHVNALSRGHEQHWGEAPPPWEADEYLFGGTGEEPIYPVGQVDELIEMIKTQVEPATWERVAGADIRSQGERFLIVSAPAATIAAVARYLTDLETRILRTARVEVRAVATPEGGWPSDGDAQVAHVRASQSPTLSLLGFEGQRVSAYSGTQYAYVGGYRVNIAQDASMSQPLVHVANLGLIADALVTFGDEPDTARIQIRCHFSTLDATTDEAVGDKRILQMPVFGRTSASGLLTVPLGAWRPVGGGSSDDGMQIWIRVTRGQSSGTPARAPRLSYDAAPGGTYTTHAFDVTPFDHAVSYRQAGSTHLTPSYWTPPEPAELGEPAPLFPPENLVELIRAAGPRRLWQDPASIEARNGRLFVRQTPAVAAAIRKLLATLRPHAAETLTVDAEVLDVSHELAERLRGGPSFGLDAGTAAALTSARKGGQAERLGSATVRVLSGGSNYTLTGQERTYVGDYSVKIAQGAAASTPGTYTFFDGLRLTVAAERTSTRDRVALHVEFQRTQQNSTARTATTPCGPVQLPMLPMLRTRCACMARVGETILLAATSRGERMQVVLLTPRWSGAR